MDNRFPQAAEHRPAPGVLGALEPSLRGLLENRGVLDERFLNTLGSLLPDGHPLRRVPGAALDLLDVLMRAVLSGDPPDRVEAECQECGARCAAVGLPDDTFPAVGRAAARAAREVTGEAWTSAMSSGWAALHLWVVEHLTLGASRNRSRGQVWQSFPELAPPKPAPGQLPDDTAPTTPVPSSPAAEWALLEQAAGMAPADVTGAQPVIGALDDAFLAPGGDGLDGGHDPRRAAAGDGRHGRRARREPGESPEQPWSPDPSWTP